MLAAVRWKAKESSKYLKRTSAHRTLLETFKTAKGAVVLSKQRQQGHITVAKEEEKREEEEYTLTLRDPSDLAFALPARAPEIATRRSAPMSALVCMVSHLVLRRPEQ